MIRFLLAVLLISFIHVSGNSFNKRSQLSMDWINFGKIASEYAEISEAPYQVAMLYSKPGGNYFQACGGSIISPNVIVSAGHCPYNTIAADWKVRAGSAQSDFGGQLLDVTRTIIHPNYNESTVDYDISLFILASDINIDGINTKIIPLPEQDVFVADNTEAFVTGWGSTREEGNPVRSLRKVKIPIVNQKVCTDSYAGFSIVTPRMICAGILKTGGKDACHGDSGGPLVVDDVLIGITSWGKGCARAGYLGVWTRVPALRNWINSNIP